MIPLKDKLGISLYLLSKKILIPPISNLECIAHFHPINSIFTCRLFKMFLIWHTKKVFWALLILPTSNKLLNNQTQIFCPPPPLSLYIQEYQCTNPPPKKNCEGESKKISKFKQGLRLTISFRSQQLIYFFCLESNSVQQGGQWMYWYYNIRIMVGVKPYFDMFEWKGVRNLSTLTQQ